MKREEIVIAATIMVIAFPFTIVSPVFAEVTYIQHIGIMGDNIDIVIPDTVPPIVLRISFAHFDGGSHGIRDGISLYVLPEGAPRWAMTAWYSDTDEGFAYISELMAGTNTKVEQLKSNEIQVRGETNVVGRWSVPLVSPAVMGFPEITVPPGHITLNQYGDEMTGSQPPVPFPSGFKYSVIWTGYAAEGHFVCPEWHCNEQITGARIITDATQTATHP